MSRRYQNKVSNAEGFNIGTQTPVDDRLYFNSVADLQDIGYGNNSRAYEYYEGMVIKLIDTAEMYMWKESTTGALTTSFTYPAGIIANGVDYSNRTFNFVSMTVSTSLTTVSTDVRVISLVGNTPLTVTIPASAEITDVSLYTATNNDISDSLDMIIGTNQVTLEANIDLANLTLKTIYKQ